MRETFQGLQVFLQISGKLPSFCDIAPVLWDTAKWVEGKEYNDFQILTGRSMTKEGQRLFGKLRRQLQQAYIDTCTPRDMERQQTEFGEAETSSLLVKPLS